MTYVNNNSFLIITSSNYHESYKSIHI